MTANRPDPSAWRAVFLAFYYPPMSSSGASRPDRFVRFLPRFGYQCSVVAADPGTPGGRRENTQYVEAGAPQSWGARWAAWILSALQRYLLPYNEQMPWIAPAVVAASNELAKRPHPALIFSTSPPLATHLAAWWLKRKHNIRWVADFRDPLSDNPFRRRRWLFSYDRWLEGRLIRDADAVIVNTDSVADLWRQRYPGFKEKIHLIWNGFDPEEPVEDNPGRRGPAWEIAHVGNLYGGRHPGAFLDSITRLLRAGRLNPEDWHIHLIGPLEDACLKPSQPAVDYLGQQGCLTADGKLLPKEQAQRKIREADYLLLLDLNTEGTGFQVPAKLFDYIRAGKPILAWTPAGSPTGRILAMSGIPHRVFDPLESAGATDQKVLELLSTPSSRTLPQPEFLAQFDGERQVSRLAEIFDKLMQEDRSGPSSRSL